MPGGDMGRSRHAGTSTTYGESGDHSIWTYELCGAPQWGAGIQAGCRHRDVGARDGVLRAYERTVTGCGAEGGVAGPRVHRWVKEGGASARQRWTGGVRARGAYGGQGRALGVSQVARGRARMPVGVGARRALWAGRARAEHIRAGDACAGANEPGKASAGGGALQVTAGTLWGAVGTSTQWRREQNASEGEVQRWRKQDERDCVRAGCMRRAERIRPREACADSRKGGGRKSCSNANGAKQAQQ
ncbi:hypothetical protein DFH08DRAFT_812762 [Mycena albidolilacea]|uniref:Uncharacterized protein n=1 Tax=Mycena albidolilacea TaxID=1033008 RepID=A0AAD6ZSR1_9AGAR|nr:hypothetical protein DFH08DRAFT_812762 [Mycena albidolilacea]